MIILYGLIITALSFTFARHALRWRRERAWLREQERLYRMERAARS